MARRDRWPNAGLLALVAAGGGLLTGAFLALGYAPTLDAARASIVHLQERVPLGAFLRGLHHWSGTFALVLAGLHGARLLWHGAYKAPRRRLWVLGCLLFLVLLGFAYTGYLLRGDARAAAGVAVAEGVARSTPGIGDAAAALLLGGDVYSSATLTRIYAAHAVFLPAALLALVAAFVVTWRRLGPAPHHGDPPAAADAGVPLADLRRDAVYAGAVLLAIAAAGAVFGAGVGAAADPDDAAAAAGAKPEWFFLWINELLYRMKGATFLAGAAVPGLVVVLFTGFPFWFRAPDRAPRRRKAELVVAAATLLALAGLTASALARTGRPPRGAAPAAAATPGGDLDEQAQGVRQKFKCAKCHVIDGEASELATGPELARAGRGALPPFRELYTRAFFRAKVGDPRAFWPDTAMVYSPMRLKPTAAELDVLERWFFGD